MGDRISLHQHILPTNTVRVLGLKIFRKFRRQRCYQKTGGRSQQRVHDGMHLSLFTVGLERVWLGESEHGPEAAQLIMQRGGLAPRWLYPLYS